ncbi:hypothetical protein ElyMa_001690700 [Elysia marginata]|uniref:Uncharacterized protein n=1 Tax=Elysia marginata TaxID=1093978 RepID=A0AAV4JS18_9GAST|nr:hypothetical protein ElyMa_001690700 [Elysia marginata]
MAVSDACSNSNNLKKSDCCQPHNNLITLQEWDIHQLPALVYQIEGFSRHELLSVDVTVDDVVEAIARTLHGNFAGLTRTYCVRLNNDNYDEMITTPRQSVLILLYDKDEKSEMETFEKVAYAFRKDDSVCFR